IGYTLLRVIVVLAPQTLPRLAEVHFDWGSVAFCFAVSGAVGVILGRLPLGSTELDVALLRDGVRGLTLSRPRELARRGLVLTQVALAVVLLSGAALMVKSFAHLRAVRPGFDPSGVETMIVILPQRYNTYQQAETFWRAFIQRVEAIRGVVHAGAVDQLPLDGDLGCSGVIVDVTNAVGESGNCMAIGIATPGFVETMGIHVQGVPPTWSSLEAGTGQAIVTAAFARRFWAGANPVGHRVTPFNSHNPPFPIVAETQDILANGLQNPPIQPVYFSLVPPAGMQQWQVGNGLTLVVKAPALSSAALMRSIRGILTQVESQALIADIRPMESVVARSIAQTSFTMLLLLIAATIAVALSAVGIYGVVSYVVGQRRGEIGIRMALGAQLSDVSRLIVGQSATLAVAGVAIGLVLTLGGTRLLRSLLFDVKANDPMILVGTAGALLVVALVASVGPVRRAARIDPVEAMRS
ncbi:MAG TPA: FtsX-like permease family protein, partial [Gemmatimonadaceae bacterium]